MLTRKEVNFGKPKLVYPSVSFGKPKLIYPWQKEERKLISASRSLYTLAVIFMV